MNGAAGTAVGDTLGSNKGAVGRGGPLGDVDGATGRVVGGMLG